MPDNDTNPTSNSSPEGLGRQLVDLQRENSRLQQSLDYANGEIDRVKDENNNLQTQFTSLQNQYASKTTEVQAVQGLYAAGVLPEYTDIMTREAAQAISQAGDKPITEVMDGLRQKYPAMFRAEGNPVGAGASSSATPPAPPTTPTVSAGDNSSFLSNLEGIANGSVQLR